MTGINQKEDIFNGIEDWDKFINSSEYKKHLNDTEIRSNHLEDENKSIEVTQLKSQEQNDVIRWSNTINFKTYTKWLVKKSKEKQDDDLYTTIDLNNFLHSNISNIFEQWLDSIKEEIKKQLTNNGNNKLNEAQMEKMGSIIDGIISKMIDDSDNIHDICRSAVSYNLYQFMSDDFEEAITDSSAYFQKVVLGKEEKVIYEGIWNDIQRIEDRVKKNKKSKLDDELQNIEIALVGVIRKCLDDGIMLGFPYKDNLSILYRVMTLMGLIHNSTLSPSCIDTLLEKYRMFEIFSQYTTLDQSIVESEELNIWVSGIVRHTQILSQRKDFVSKLKDKAYEGIIGNKESLKIDIHTDNGYLYIKYSKNSTVVVATIINNYNYKSSGCNILQISTSIVKIKKVGEQKRNYTDLIKGSITIYFNTEVGKIKVYLYIDKTNDSKIKVRLDEGSKENFNMLENKENLGKNCLLGGKSVFQAIQDKEFIRGHGIEKEDKIIERVPSSVNMR